MRFVLFFFVAPIITDAQYQVLSKNSGAKTTVVTQWTHGYVQKISGDRLEGKIQLKVVNRDTVEVRYKSSGKEKFEFPRDQVKSFGRMIDPSQHSNNPRNNFQPGYVLLKNGNRLEGKIRLVVTEVITGAQASFPNAVEFSDASNNLTDFFAYQAQGAAFTINDSEVSYESYKTGFLELLAKGKLNLMPNPYPTTQAEFATDMAKAVDSSMTKKPSDAAVYRNEYLIRREGENSYTAITPHTYENWAKQLIRSCQAFNLLDPNSRDEFTHWNKAVDAVKFYNERCK
jgi:hypothetical protein